MADRREKLRAAFAKGVLRVRSVSPDGLVSWKRVLGVHRAEVGAERVRQLSTAKGPAVMTAGHRVYVSPTSKIEADRISTTALGLEGLVSVQSNVDVGTRRFMYDLTAEDWHNFVLHRSGLVVSNSPDRNYHFRPPTHEATINQYNRVFGYIWEDAELVEYINRALDMVSAAPPRTVFRSCDQLMQCYPEWRTLMLNGAMMHALMALTINWIADEFDYSIGGVNLTIEKSSKYESAYSNIKDNFETQIERAKQTVKIVKGLQQPRYGVGIRSAFGPYVGRGVLTPRKFVGF